MIKYPHINGFSNIYKDVRRNADFQGMDESGEPIYLHKKNYPSIPFYGTVKLHGTNGAIVLHKDGHNTFQSRNNELSLGNDNVGFYAANALKDFTWLREMFEFRENIAIFGEWAGQGIQKSVGISKLPRQFYVFSIMVDNRLLNVQEMSQICDERMENLWNYEKYPQYHINIDFDAPESAVEYINSVTNDVEKECPVSLVHGVANGIGEGVVWSNFDRTLVFKSKGALHQENGDAKPAQIKPDMTNENKFVEQFVNQNRLENVLGKFLETYQLDKTCTGHFIRMVEADVLREGELSILESQLDASKLKNPIAYTASRWFINRINK